MRESTEQRQLDQALATVELARRQGRLPSQLASPHSGQFVKGTHNELNLPLFIKSTKKPRQS